MPQTRNKNGILFHYREGHVWHKDQQGTYCAWIGAEVEHRFDEEFKDDIFDDGHDCIVCMPYAQGKYLVVAQNSDDEYSRHDTLDDAVDTLYARLLCRRLEGKEEEDF